MALHDYACPTCGYRLIDEFRSCEEGATARLPLCPTCRVSMIWIPQVGRMDALEPMQEFEVCDGRNQRVVVDSLHKLRQIERESEQLARNGEGQQMVWRQYSQDPSNRHTHTLGQDPTPKITGLTRRGQPILREVLQPGANGEPEVTMGDGVVGVSPLPLASGE
jgi:hypothetical protein